MQHLENIVEVIKLTPEVKHWLPTKEYKLITSYMQAKKCIPDNLTIRVSMPMLNMEVQEKVHICALGTLTMPTGVTFSTAFSKKILEEKKVKGFVCQAKGLCGDCRACWSTKVPCVIYPLH
jgi:hypothetical protein